MLDVSVLAHHVIYGHHLMTNGMHGKDAGLYLCDAVVVQTTACAG
jgi:hypothetical protein